EIIQSIKKAEVELYKKISELSKKYGKEHPRMKAALSELQTLQERKNAEIGRIIDSLNNEYQVALAREASLMAALERQKQESLELNKKAIEYGVLKREAEGARELYDLLIRRFKETSVTEEIDTGNIRIIDRAESAFKVSPNTRRNFKLAVVVGLMLGLGLAFLLEYLDNTIKTPEELEQVLNMPYLGLIPLMDMNKSGLLRNGFSEDLITIKQPRAVASESYRSIRTRIVFSSPEHAPKSMLITSVTGEEGKTLTSANLAITMAQAGSKVILLDCDMRKPRLHRLLGLNRDRGVSNVLVGDCNLDEVIVETKIPNLHAISCGPIPPNPSELLGSSAMVNLIAGLGREYDRIVIDSPPLAAVTDAIVLAKIVDGTVVVLQANSTPKEMAKNVLHHLQVVKAHILGVVLNKVDLQKNAYYYRQNYYHYLYGDDAVEPRKNVWEKVKEKTARHKV
ncbi:MAG: polysaccharide biosynthesis tyrosine autokinase, partial [Desulfobulbales bacterium]|nr:polysaccharide biosynthesis tyrosine autokinase [Desulfobulbales bacterium]